MIYKVYFNKYKAYFDTGKKKVLSLVSFIAILGISITTGNMLTAEIIDVFLNGNDHILYSAIITYLASESSLVMLFFLFAKITMPENSNIFQVINLLPVSAIIKHFSCYSLQIIAEVTIPLLIYMSILLPKMIIKTINFKIILLLIFIFILQAIFMAMLFNAIYNFSLFMFDKLKFGYAHSYALFLNIIVFFLLMWIQFKNFEHILLNYSQFDYGLLHWCSGFMGKMLNGKNYQVSISIITFLFIIIFFAGIISFNFLRNISAQIKSTSIFMNVFHPSSKILSMMLKDVKLLLRLENVVFLLIILLISQILMFIFKIDLEMKKYFLKIFISVSGGVAVFSFGSDCCNIPFYKLLGIQKKIFIFSKFVSSLLISGILTISLLLINFRCIETFYDLFRFIFILLLSTLMLLSIGVIFPFTKTNTFSQAIVSTLSFILFFPISYFFKVLEHFSYLGRLGLIFCISLIFFVIVANVFNKRWNGDYI
ncbi:MAG: hypothetical protein LBF82_00525 [Lactobacillales bacterium]|jgi:hypothetical protein|nr:hypothetical protein [Lactobacillales bacterium]